MHFDPELLFFQFCALSLNQSKIDTEQGNVRVINDEFCIVSFENGVIENGE